MPASASLKHKETNKFRFKNFSELLAEVNVGTRTIRKNVLLDDENDSCFTQAMLKWKDLDLTSHFASFRKNIASKWQNYRIVVHNAQFLLETLEKHLQVEKSLALQSLLEILASACEDLRGDFYPYFPRFFNILVNLLDTKDTQKLQWTFTCMTQLFKQLWRLMVKDLDSVLRLYSNLFVGSKPKHIASFAAQSVSFLLRKASNHLEVFTKLFDILLESSSFSADRLAQLVLEVVKAPQFQFHVCINQVLIALFTFLDTEDTDEKVVECICISFGLMVSHTKQKYAKVLLEPILDKIKMCSEHQNELGLKRSLRLLRIYSQVHNGSRLLELDDVIACFENALIASEKSQDTDLRIEVCELSSSLLKSNKAGFEEDDRKRIIELVCNSEFHFDEKKIFWKLIFELEDFQEIGKRFMLKYFQHSIQTKINQVPVISLLTDWCLSQQDLPNNADELSNYQLLKHQLPSIKSTRKITTIICELLEDPDPQTVCKALILSTRIKLSFNESFHQVLHDLINRYTTGILNGDNFAVISLTLQTLVHLKKDGEDFKFASFAKRLRHHLDDYVDNKDYLLSLDIITSLCDETSKIFSKDHNLQMLLTKNLSNSHLDLHSLILRILRKIDDTTRDLPVYDYLIQAVDTPNTVQDFRQRLVHLRKLNRDQKIYEQLQGVSKQAVIRTLFSTFYINLSLLWQPTRDIIASLATESIHDDFWTILFELLDDAATKARSIKWWLKQTKRNKSRIDDFNFRLQLLETVSSLPYASTVEGKNRYLSQMLFDFIEKEYAHVDSYSMTSQDLSDATADVDVVCRRKDAVGVLVAMLKIFARFRDMKSAAQKERLRTLYEELLTHSNVALQRAAFDCILSFRNRHLLKIQETFINFFDDKKFKVSLTNFDMEQMSDDARDDVIPTLLLLLYGRMRSSTGVSTLGKSHAPLRRSVIIRFLSKLDHKFISIFFDMVARPYLASSSLQTPILLQEFVDGVVSSTSIIPIKKQLGFIGTVQTLLSKMRKEMPVEIYSKLICILMKISSSSAALIKSDLVSKRHISALKNLRKLSVECLLEVFTLWPDSSWMTKDQIESLFRFIILPNLHKLINENQHHPTVDLKLLLTLTTRRRYLPILATKISTGQFQSLAHTLVEVMTAPKTSKVVIQDIINSLLRSLIPTEDEEELSIEQCDQLILISSSLIDSSLTSQLLHKTSEMFALQIFRPFIPQIVNFFAHRLEAKLTGINSEELQLISIFCEHIDQSCEDTLNQLCKILIRHITKSSSGGRVSWKLITDCLKTLYHVTKSPNHINQLAPLFSKLRDRLARVQLVKVFERACQDVDELKWTSEMVSGLNKWDDRFVEEVDFDTRLHCFSDLEQIIKSNDQILNDVKGFLPIFHTLIFTLLNHSNDMSLRNYVTLVLDAIISQVATMSRDHSSYCVLIRDVLLIAIQKGVQSHEIICRRESFLILRKILLFFPEEPLLCGLQHLINSKNEEDDSFLNLQHVQLHRQARALRNFATNIHPNRVIVPAVAIRYLLPYVEQTLHTVKISKDSGFFREACLDVVMAIASVMTWSALKRFLLRTIRNFDKKPASIDILRAALDAFPFDLSSFDGVIKDEDFETETGASDVINDQEKSDSVANKEEGTDDIIDDDKESDSVIDNDEEEEVDDVIDEEEADDVIDEEVAMETNDVTDQQKQQKKIVQELVNIVLPRLRALLSRHSSNDDVKHKHAQHQQSPIEMCKRKLPLAVAVVSMLSKCPQSILTCQLNSIVYKLVDYLRHRQFSIRELARDSLCKCLAILGHQHLASILRVLKTELSRGYQKHVLVRTTCNLLSTLSAKLKAGDLDKCISLLAEILLEDLFGKSAEEKKVDAFRAKIPEAKGRSRVFGALQLIASVVGSNHVTLLMKPLRHEAEKTNDFALKKIIKDCLSEVSQGLISNQQVDHFRIFEDLLTREIISKISGKKINHQQSIKPTQHPGSRPESCLLLSKASGRLGSVPGVKNSKSNLHLIVEFALQLVHLVIKKENHDQKSLERFDSLIEAFDSCLSARHRQTVVNSMRCIQRLLRSDLPSLHQYAPSIIQQLFKIVKDNSQGNSDQESALISFKTLGVLCQSDYGSDLNDVQLKTLLIYAESDMDDSQRQSHAFELIKAIMKRGLKGEDVQSTLNKSRAIAIQAHTSVARQQARNLYLFYVLKHCREMTTRVLERHIEFILQQLDYEFEDGRLSAMELISSLITDFPVNIIAHHYYSLIFISTSARLVNDQSPRCRKAASVLLKLLLRNITNDQRDELYLFVVNWYSDDLLPKQHLASMLVSIFAEVEDDETSRRLNKILPLISDKLQFSTCSDLDEGESLFDHFNLSQLFFSDDIRENDHSYFHHLSAMLSLARHCEVLTDSKWRQLMQIILKQTEDLLLHPHDWVRLAASQLFGLYFGSLEPDSKQHFVTTSNCSELAEKFCQQLDLVPLKPAEISTQSLKNIIYILRVLDHHQNFKAIKAMIVHMVDLSKKEQASRPKCTEQRSAVLKFCAAFAKTYSDPLGFLKFILDPIHRCCNATATHGDQEIDVINQLRDLATECLSVVKKQVDSREFVEVYAKVDRELAATRRERKMKRDQLAVTDPTKAASLKIKKQERTKEQRKRKNTNFRPECTVKKVKQN